MLIGAGQTGGCEFDYRDSDGGPLETRTTRVGERHGVIVRRPRLRHRMRDMGVCRADAKHRRQQQLSPSGYHKQEQRGSASLHHDCNQNVRSEGIRQ